MKQLAILIPASPTRAFFSQISAFSLALSRLNWRRWEPTVHVFMGGEPDFVALEEWRPHLRDTMMSLVPASLSDAHQYYYAQIDSAYRCAPADADALMRVDADTLPVRNFEDLLDYVVEADAVAGVTAHFKFPTRPGENSRESWLRLADELIAAPLDFSHAYSLTSADAPEDEWSTPFYVNDGMVLFARRVFPEVVQHYLRLRPQLMDRLWDPYFSGQIALALAVAETGVRTCALPMRYNFPNDELAETRFPEELENVTLFHYLRTDKFDRQRIFASAEGYREFLGLDLVGSNKIFQTRVAELIGPEYPFAAASERKPVSTTVSDAAEAASAPADTSGSGTPIKVSVLLITYNHAPFITQALDSILMQETDFAFEIIVWDDASTDGTRDIVVRHAAQNPDKFRLVFNEANLGCSRAGNVREWLVRQSANGIYVALIEGDDYWTDARKLRKQVDFLDANPEFVLCAHDHVVKNEWLHSEAAMHNSAVDVTLGMEQLLEGCQFHTSSLMYRKAALSDWPSEFFDLGFSDWSLHILLAQCGAVRLLAEPMSVYRVHSGGAWSARYVIRGDNRIPETNAEGLQIAIDFLERINAYLNYQYDAHIRSLIARKQQQAAMLAGEAAEG